MNNSEVNRILRVLTLSDKLNNAKDTQYKNANKYRSLRASIKPVKTLDVVKEKPNELPISEMIWNNIDKIEVVPGIWTKLCDEHFKKNQEITQTHEAEVKGADLSLAAFRRDRMRLYSQPLTRQNSPTRSSRYFQMNSRHSDGLSIEKSGKTVHKVKFIASKQKKRVSTAN